MVPIAAKRTGRRALALAFAVLAGLLASAVPALGSRIDDEKSEVVRQCAEKMQAGARLSGLSNDVSKAHALLGIESKEGPAGVVVTLRTTGTPTCRTFTVEEGSKFVVDLYETINLIAIPKIAPPVAGLMMQIRTSQYALEPRFVSRVVFDLDGAFTAHVSDQTGLMRFALASTQGKGNFAIEIREEAVDTTSAEDTAKEMADTSGAPTVAASPVLDVKKVEAGAIAARIAEDVLPEGDAKKVDASTVDSDLLLARLDAEIRHLKETAPTQSLPVAAEPMLITNANTSSNGKTGPATTLSVEKVLAGLESVKAADADTMKLADVKLASVDGQAAAPEANTPVAAAEPAPVAPPTPEAAPSDTTSPPASVPGSEVPAAPAPAESQTTAPAESAPATDAPAQDSATSTLEPQPAPEPAPSAADAPADPVEAQTTKDEKAEEAAPSATEAAPKTVSAFNFAGEPGTVSDPLERRVNIDFRGMKLSQMVALLSKTAQVNVIGTGLTDTPVDAQLHNVPLRQALETVLRMNDLGLVEEEGIFRVVPYEQALEAQRSTLMVHLEKAKAEEVKKTLDDVLISSPDGKLTSVSTNATTNVLIIAGPDARVQELEQMARQLDVAKPVAPTVTEAIKLNYAEAEDMVDVVKNMLSKDTGQVTADKRSRHIVVTDAPVVLEQIRQLVKEVDLPVRQVNIDAMIVDAALDDTAETGVDWILKAVPERNTRNNIIGSLQDIAMETDATSGTATPGSVGDSALANSLTFGILTGEFNLKAMVSAQVKDNKAELLANPVLVTVENKKANIDITSDIPYQKLTQTTNGPAVASTEFKSVGTTLEVTPQVTHDNHVIAEITAKQSGTKGEFNNIPIEDKREAQTTLRSKDGQTIFIGGLRRFDDEQTHKKVPVIGDIPIITTLFSNNVVKKKSTELLIFLTCSILKEEMPDLSPELLEETKALDNVPDGDTAQKGLGKGLVKPYRCNPPAWKWRRSE